MTQPSTKSIFSFWRHDLIAGLSVALVALPLSMGIAIASGIPPIAGLISAIVGGVLATFIRGSHMGINGPGAGLIIVTLSALDSLGDGTVAGYPYVLAAFIVAGALQVLLGFLRLGKLGDFFPSSVINGMLAAIGVIIMAKQINLALGTPTEARDVFDILQDLPRSLANLNPFVTGISLVSVIVLIFHPRIKSKFVSFIPAAMWVLIFAIPLVYAFNFFEEHQLQFGSNSYTVGPQYLINVPDNLLSELIRPDFSKINTFSFWLTVIAVTLVSSLESLLSSKAVDTLDPQKRKTNLNKDIAAMGVSTIISGFLGGLPVITVITRSSVNLHNGGRTRLSNFYHGLILAIMVLLLASVIQQIPLAALAAILVFTGYKLASPKVFTDINRKGLEQMVIFTATLLCVIEFGLVVGILLGIAGTLFLHYALLRVPTRRFGKYLISPSVKTITEGDNKHIIRIKGIANFFNLLPFIKKLKSLPKKSHVILDFSHARLVDYTVLEYVHEFSEKYQDAGGTFDLVGLGMHKTFSDHPFALHVSNPPKQTRLRLTKRQLDLKQIAAENQWVFDPDIVWDTSAYRDFQFFLSRPVEYSRNVVKGSYGRLRVDFELADITFDEGAFLAKEVYHTTTQLIHLKQDIPVFSLEKEGYMDRFLQFVTNDQDIDFDDHSEFSKNTLLQGPDEEAIKRFFTPDIIKAIESNEVYHIESNGKSLLVFKSMRLSSGSEVRAMIQFTEQLLALLPKATATSM